MGLGGGATYRFDRRARESIAAEQKLVSAFESLCYNKGYLDICSRRRSLSKIRTVKTVDLAPRAFPCVTCAI